jgi:hypothetical protein
MIEHESPAFISNQKRTMVFESNNKVPPVGHYNSSQNIIKKTFNSRFKKDAENKIKKNKVFRQYNSS